MRLAFIAMVVCAVACDESKPQFPDAGTFVVAVPPTTQPAPELTVVAGASAADGKAAFARLCSSCHGATGVGNGPQAASLPHAPTNLTESNYLCRTTVGGTGVPSPGDVEDALGRGTHRGQKDLAALDAATRRSLTLAVVSMAPGFSRAALPVLTVPAETPDTPADRARGRILYLAMGCWKCHGADGAGVGTIKSTWNGRALDPFPLHDRQSWLCGSDPTRTFQTLSLGMGQEPTVMPGYGEYADVLARPLGDPETWLKSLVGHVPDAEVAAVQAFYEALPDRMTTHGQPLAERRARGAGYLWSLVHYSRGL